MAAEEISHIDLEVGSSVWYVDLENEYITLTEVKEINIKLTNKGEEILYICDNPRTDGVIKFYQGKNEESHVFLSQEKAEKFLNDQDDEHGKLYMLYSTDGYTDHDMQVVVVPYRYIRSNDGILTNKGAEWFRKKYLGSFDNGGYYRLKEITKEYISKLIDKINNYTNIVDLWNQNNK